ncbi:MAG: phosphotransacetylase family protein [Candidatus Eisenbacteria sp.]|nr:phosphotransacetylase family protein [Candidatus Eisenbacteria bacterium]
MRRLIIASMRKSAGKTSVIVGLGKAMQKKIGYLKPFGDRLLYRKKRLWDYDSALVTRIFGLDESPEDMSLGFDHSKLRFMYDDAGTQEKLQEMLAGTASGKEVMLIEGGKEISYGISVHLDPLTLARHMDATLVLVVSGDEGTILDEATFIKQHIRTEDVGFAGVIVNQIHDLEDFRNNYQKAIEELGIPVLGVLPFQDQLTHLSLAFLAECLFAKVIAGEAGLQRVVKDIFVGAMSTDAALRNPFFTKSNKLLITSGDRSDMILAALEGDTSGIVLTNNILPPANIISRAAERNVPLLLIAADTYEAAKQVDNTERLLTSEDEEKIALLGKMIGEHIDVRALLEG